MKSVLIISGIFLTGCIGKEYGHSYDYSDYPYLDGYCYDEAVRKSKSREYNPNSLAQELTYERCLKRTRGN